MIRGTLDPRTSGASAGLWVGESGILLGLATVVFAGVLVRGKWQMRRAPGETPFAEVRALEV